MKIKRQPVVYGSDKICPRQWRALDVGDGDQRHIRKPTIQRHVIGKVLSAMKRRHSSRSFRSKQWKVQVVDMKVQDIEIGGTLAHFVQHQRVMRNRVTGIRIEAQRTGRALNQLG